MKTVLLSFLPVIAHEVKKLVTHKVIDKISDPDNQLTKQQKEILVPDSKKALTRLIEAAILFGLAYAASQGWIDPSSLSTQSA